MTEELPDAEANEAWLRERQRLLDDYHQLTSLPCPTGKQKHRTKETARSQSMSLRANRGPGKTNVFFCTMCGSYHCGRR